MPPGSLFGRATYVSKLAIVEETRINYLRISVIDRRGQGESNRYAFRAREMHSDGERERRTIGQIAAEIAQVHE